MPYWPPFIPRIAPPSQHPVDPRSLDLQQQQSLSPEVMLNPEYWSDGTTTHIFPEEKNPTRRQGIQKIGGIFGDGQRGGIFGAKVDPLLVAELQRRAVEKRQMARGLEAAAKAPSTIGSRAQDWWNKSTFFKPAWDDLVGGLTAPGDVMSGAQPTMVADPQTGEFHTDPRLADRAGALAGAVTLGAGAIPAEANALRMGIKAYHGSPHDFERFDSSKIGTGEGAQAYGHGMYFAEREGVARDYRDQLSKARSSFAHPDLGEMSRDQLDVVLLQEVKRVAPNIEQRQADMMAVNTVDALENGDDFNAMRRWVQEQGGPPEDEAAWFAVLKKAQEFKAQPAQGRMYEVDIAADPEHFLDWDKPLSEQSPQVRRGYAQAVAGGDPIASELLDESPESLRMAGLFPKSSGAQAYNTLAQSKRDIWRKQNTSPQDVPSSRQIGEWAQGASEQLREAGIPGIRYLDQGSRVSPLGRTRAQIEQSLMVLRDDLALASDPEKRKLIASRIASREEELKHFDKETRNYVVFDDRLISILKKYGLPISAAGLAALSQLHPQEAQAAQKKQKGR